MGGDGDSDKAKRIAAIRKEGREPIIRVIARGLSEPEALLHKQLDKFDFRNAFYYYNVGEGRHRN